MYSFLVSALLLCGAVLGGDIKEEEGVLVLGKDNFQDAISNNEYILVEFYAPWCGHCKALAPEYAKAAAQLKEQGSNIRLAKVDATVEGDLAESHNVRGYPTLKFFKKGTPFEYTGGRQADQIVSWVVKKSGPSAKSLSSVAEVKEFVDAGTTLVGLGLFKDENSAEAQTFLQVTDSIDDFPFAISSHSDVLNEYGADKNKVVLFKKFGEPNAEIDEITTVDLLRNKILAESLPLIAEFNHNNAKLIFGGIFQSFLLLFMSQKEGHLEKYLPPLKDLAKQYREKVLFVSIDSDEPDHKRILEFFGLKEDDVPSFRIIKLEEEMIKYKPDSDDFSPENVGQFVQDYIDGKLKESLLSQTLPEDWDAKPVKVLVSTNFDEVALNKDKHVLVEFYAPWCSHCQQLAPIYDQLGEAFKDREDVVIAKMDATANELAHTKISNFPTLKLYKKGDNEVIEYNGPRTLDGLKKFIESDGAQSGGPSTDEEEEEEHLEDHPKDEL